MTADSPDSNCSTCPFNALATLGDRLSSRNLTAPLNCSVLSDCAERSACMGRIMLLVDALEAGDKPRVSRLLRGRGVWSA